MRVARLRGKAEDFQKLADIFEGLGQDEEARLAADHARRLEDSAQEVGQPAS